MKISIRDFFRAGDFWTGLQDTLDKITARINQQAQNLADSDKKCVELIHQIELLQLNAERREDKLVQQIDTLRHDNRDLRDRLAGVEQRLWSLSVGAKSESVVIVQPLEEDGLQKRLTG